MFGRPSLFDLQRMATGAASIASQIKLTNEIDDFETKQLLLQQLREEFHVDTMDRFTTSVAEKVASLKLGWFKRNNFLGALEANLKLFGFAEMDARELKEDVEHKTMSASA